MDYIKVCEEWEKKRLPIINGIIHSDGKVDRIDVGFEESTDYRRILIHSGKEELSSFSLEEHEYSDATVFGEIYNEEKGIVVVYGGGSYGGDGFVLVKSNKAEIMWLAFFEESNEFIHCEIIENNIMAYNNSGEKWVFDIDMPETLFIIIEDKKQHSNIRSYEVTHGRKATLGVTCLHQGRANYDKHTLLVAKSLDKGINESKVKKETDVIKAHVPDCNGTFSKIHPRVMGRRTSGSRR